LPDDIQGELVVELVDESIKTSTVSSVNQSCEHIAEQSCDCRFWKIWLNERPRNRCGSQIRQPTALDIFLG